MGLKNKIALLVFINSLLFFGFSKDINTALSLLFGLFIALLLNVQSHRTIEKTINKVYRGADFALASLLVGETMKFVFLWALLLIGYKGLGLLIKEMLFTFIFYYLFFIFYNLVQKRH